MSSLCSTTARALYGGDFPLVDLTILPDNQIMAHRRMAMLELLQKHIRRRDLAELQEQLVTLIAGEHLSAQQLGALVRYMLQVGNTADPVALIRTLVQHAPQQKEMLMTIAEWLEDQGWKKGLLVGRQEGRKEGHHAGREEQTLEIAKRLLKHGLPSELISEVTGLSPQALAQLSH